MNDDIEQYRASNFLKKKYKDDDVEQYRAENFRKKKPEEKGFFNKLPRNIAAGVSELGRGLANTPHNLASLIGLGDKVANLADPSFDYAKFYGLEEEPTLSDKLIRGFAQYAPAVALPGSNLGRAGEAIGTIPKAGEFLAGAAEQAVPQAAFGATQNENPLMGALEGGAGSAAGSGLGAVLEKGINVARPSRILRGQLSPAQLKKNLEVTKGTDTALGQVLENPILNKAYENVLPHVLGSGAEKTAAANANKIKIKGDKLLKNLNGNIQPHEYSIKLQDALKTAVKEAKTAKEANYNKLNTLADKENLKVGRKNFQEKAAGIIEDIQQSPELEAEFGKDLYNDLIRYANNPKGNTLKLTNIFRGKLGDKANELYQAGKTHEYGLVNDLKASLSEDIDQAFNQSGNKELKAAYQKAQKEYKENYAPFEDKDIVKFTRQGGDPDLILNHFLKTGANDRATLLSKLDRAYKLNKSAQGKQENLISSAYLSKAIDEEGNINPVKFRTLYNKLGKNQKKILFGEGSLHKKIGNYADLVGKNLESFYLMHNPKTGARLSAIAQAVLIPSHLPAAIAAGLGGKAATKLLTSEKFREKLINAMVKNKNISLPKTKAALQKGLSIAPGISDSNYGNSPMELDLNWGTKE